MLDSIFISRFLNYNFLLLIYIASYFIRGRMIANFGISICLSLMLLDEKDFMIYLHLNRHVLGSMTENMGMLLACFLFIGVRM